ncbi:MAG: proteasome ATPase, partial [Trueperella pyogenes]|nr:proteasome ATPase [Trueperella pyogenes]
MTNSDAALSILEQKNAHLSAALTQARQELLRLREQLKHLNQPPLSLGVLHRSQPTSRILEVFVSGRLMRLAADTSLDITSISPGQQVLIDDKMIVVGIGEYSRTGELAQVAELIG